MIFNEGVRGLASGVRKQEARKLMGVRY